MRAALLPLLPLLLANADPAAPQTSPAPATIPDPIKAMLDAAMTSGSEAEVQTIAKYAASAAPESAEAIRRIAGAWKDARSAAATRTLQDSGFFDLVRGRVELGGFYTTGNTRNVGLTAAADVTREGFQWRHKLRLLGEYQESLGQTTREHYLASYEPNYKIDDRLYAYGAAQYEADKFLGYFSRYSASAGAGYTAIRSRAVTLDIELGPSFRRTAFTDFTTESELGARGNLDFDWRLASGVTLSQDASAYVQNLNTTVTTRTALAAKLFGPLSAQMSYAVSYESRPPAGRVNTDTTSRASLVYAF
ncbi:YdiY family protein [Sphingomonas floccifaciens]|uniref:YdiY family protein n=1 Tax=Sphingomonas floccifaciens TaxID=1844115 RepID=A0ABW4NFH4_9SPHN